MENSNSLYVAQIQETLNDQGINTHIDGIYGPQTKNNVMEFQNARDSLMTDGMVGPATWESLFEKQYISDEPSNADESPSTEAPFLIMEGAPESMVRVVQQELNQVGIETTVDGTYGPETTANVKAFQREKEALMVDGIVGPNTWNAFNHHQ